jgi:cytochrome c-type biogenesis protein CcmH/NrfG
VPAPEDAWVAPPPEEIDAWVAPPPTTTSAPSGGESVPDLLASAAHQPPEVAEPIYRHVLELDPNEHHAAHELGDILMRRHDARGAVPLYEIVTRRRPGQAGNWIDLGDARRDAGDTAGARQAWQSALEHDPENAAAHERLGE